MEILRVKKGRADATVYRVPDYVVDMVLTVACFFAARQSTVPQAFDLAKEIRGVRG